MRLNRYIAHSGACTRREADAFIAAGKVTVNGKPVTAMGFRVRPGDVVALEGKRVSPEEKTYILLNKPAKKPASHFVPKIAVPGLAPVDNMPESTSGLQLFTNDRDLLEKFTKPDLRIREIYHVVLDEPLRQADKIKIEKGIMLNGETIKADELSYVENDPKSEIGIMRNGRPEMSVWPELFATLGYKILKLDRVALGGLTKKDLPRGRWRTLTVQEVNNLKML